MAYGEKHGFKAPGEFKIADMLGLVLAASAGIVAALVTDFQQQGEMSALFTLNRWAVALGGLIGFTDIPLWMVVIGLTVIGAGSVFYMQPITRQGAFAQGFGLLAVLVTAVPGDFAAGIESINNNLVAVEPAVSDEAAVTPRLITASFSPPDILMAQAAPAQSAQLAAKYDLTLTVTFADGMPDDIATMIRRGAIRGRLHNEETNETWSLFRSTGGSILRQGDRLVIEAGVPAQTEGARLWVRIEAPGYVIEEQSASAVIGEPLDWNIELKASNTPLMVQRLRKSYWF